MSANLPELLRKLLNLQNERRNLIELIDNRRILIDGVYRSYFRANGTSEIIPTYADIILILTTLFIGPFIWAISVKNVLTITLTIILYSGTLCVCIILRARARKHWRHINASYLEMKKAAIKKLNSEIMPQIVSMDKIFSADILNDTERVKSMLNELDKNEIYQKNPKVTIKCPYCGTNNSINEFRCRSCGAAL